MKEQSLPDTSKKHYTIASWRCGLVQVSEANILDQLADPIEDVSALMCSESWIYPQVSSFFLLWLRWRKKQQFDKKLSLCCQCFPKPFNRKLQFFFFLLFVHLFIFGTSVFLQKTNFRLTDTVKQRKQRKGVWQHNFILNWIEQKWKKSLSFTLKNFIWKSFEDAIINTENSSFS